MFNVQRSRLHVHCRWKKLESGMRGECTCKFPRRTHKLLHTSVVVYLVHIVEPVLFDLEWNRRPNHIDTNVFRFFHMWLLRLIQSQNSAQSAHSDQLTHSGKNLSHFTSHKSHFLSQSPYRGKKNMKGGEFRLDSTACRDIASVVAFPLTELAPFSFMLWSGVSKRPQSLKFISRLY